MDALIRDEAPMTFQLGTKAADVYEKGKGSKYILRRKALLSVQIT